MTLANLTLDFDEARQVARELELAGLSRANISIVANDATREFAEAEVAGAALDIPDVGPIVATGPVVPVLAGAPELLQALTRFGLSKDDAHFYSEGVGQGGALVIVNAPDDQAEEVEAILEGNHV
ncbi:MAG: general stress protein [Acidobacteriota bacterium]|nr:general stress protein [Acidobacteriota bacterium]